MKSSVLTKPVSEVVGSVSSGASVNSSGYIRFLAKIIAGGTNMPVGLMQHTTVTLCPLSHDATFQMIFFPPFGDITFGTRFGTVEIPDSSMLNLR
jgi:hypothetical protein